jgi:hypothetical protein
VVATTPIAGRQARPGGASGDPHGVPGRALPAGPQDPTAGSAALY